MPSPFPGMDPWLERPAVFPSLHGKLIYLISEALNAAMPPEYAAVGQYLVYYEDNRREPDVSVVGPRRRPRPAKGGTTTTTLALPGLTPLGRARAPAEPRRQPYLEIVANGGRRLVTSVEILSPANKGDARGRGAYLAKQDDMLLRGVSLLEIDLLRAGRHTTAIPRERLRDRLGEFDYHVAVTLAWSARPQHAAGIRLTDRLPAIGVPLDKGVPPTVIDLQPLLDRAYDTGRYPSLVSYSEAPDPPLSAEQTAWAADILRSNGVL